MSKKLNFVDRNGEFLPTHAKTKGKVSIEYLTELCEYIYYHNNLTETEKHQQIIELEKLIFSLLQSMVGKYIKYTPEWSTKFKKNT